MSLSPEGRLSVAVFLEIADRIQGERIAAHAKHGGSPVGSLEMKHWRDPAWLPVIVEELGEAAREINDLALGKHSELWARMRLRGELIQVAAMVVAWLASLDEDKWAE